MQAKSNNVMNAKSTNNIMKTKHIKMLFQTCIFIVFVSCNSEELCDSETVLHMYFYDLNTQNPVDGAQVNLIQYQGNGSQVVQQTVSNENGLVSWSCVLGINGICGSKEGYWDYCGSGHSLKDDKIKDHCYEMQPKAWVKLHVMDVEPYNSDVSLQWHSSHGDVSGILESGPHDYFMIMAVVGNSTEPMRVSKYYSSDETPFISEDVNVVVAPNDTLDYTYNY